MRQVSRPRELDRRIPAAARERVAAGRHRDEGDDREVEPEVRLIGEHVLEACGDIREAGRARSAGHRSLRFESIGAEPQLQSIAQPQSQQRHRSRQRARGVRIVTVALERDAGLELPHAAADHGARFGDIGPIGDQLRHLTRRRRDCAAPVGRGRFRRLTGLDLVGIPCGRRRQSQAAQPHTSKPSTLHDRFLLLRLACARTPSSGLRALGVIGGRVPTMNKNVALRLTAAGPAPRFSFERPPADFFPWRHSRVWSSPWRFRAR